LTWRAVSSSTVSAPRTSRVAGFRPSASRPCAWARRNSDQRGPIRRGAGPSCAARSRSWWPRRSDPELEQLALHAHVTPARVLPPHTPDQAPCRGSERRTTGPPATVRSPSPQQFPVPAAKRPRAHPKTGPPLRWQQAARGGQQRPVDARVLRPLPSPPEDRDLVAQDSDLELPLTAAANEHPNEPAQEPVQQTHQHDPQSEPARLRSPTQPNRQEPRNRVSLPHTPRINQLFLRREDRMIRLHLPVNPAEHIAFSSLPLLECVLSPHVLFGPKHHALHHQWVRRMRRLDPGIRGRVDAFRFVYGTDLPDMLVPSPLDRPARRRVLRWRPTLAGVPAPGASPFIASEPECPNPRATRPACLRAGSQPAREVPRQATLQAPAGRRATALHPRPPPVHFSNRGDALLLGRLKSTSLARARRYAANRRCMGGPSRALR
jgi:Family of unknown function (DUF5937)